MPENFAFKLYKSNKLEQFLPKVYPIIERLAKSDPLKKKSIVVQSDGMARWLTINAARHEGVFANFDFVSPDGFLRNFAEKYFGIKSGAVYNKRNAEWALYTLFRSEKEGTAASYIRNNDSRAFRLSRTLADLFEQYFVYRPNMMASWQEGRPLTDDPDELWQFSIFRKLAETKNIGTSGFAQLFNEKCKDAPENTDYPKELILFGISIMNRYQLNMFLNLSRLFPVHLFAMTPSSEYLDSVSKKKGEFEDVPEDQGFSAGYIDTFFRRFCAASLDFADFAAENLPDETDLFEIPDGKTLLSSIQRDILEDSETPEQVQNDDSVRIISCRDKMREIEVVKDTLLELFNKDKTLKPEDIAVMAPKINDYVPYITAVFGGTDPLDKDKTFIPWVISDRAFSSESSIAAAFLDILRLVRSDFEKSKVFSVFRYPFVCGKFNIDEKTVGEIEKLVGKSGVRWGLDAASRGGYAQNTWDFGLSRIMMSSFMPSSEDAECFEGILPMEYLSKEDSDNISVFITFVKRLSRCSKELTALKTTSDFKNQLEEMLDFFFVCDRNDKNRCEEMRRIRNVIDDFAETAGRYAETLSFDALLQYLEDELGRDHPGRGFLSANVNFCSLKPLRALPFKVIYMVGMGDGEFPRNENRYAFDLTQKERMKEKGAPQPRSVRDNDKYLFAEALVSAREKLIVSYEAKDFSEDSKKHRCAALPVQILEKYIGKKTGVKAEDLETKYPVHPYSEEYFKEGSTFRTFSMRDFKTAQAISMFHVEQNAQNPCVTQVSEPKELSCGNTVNEIVELNDLAAFFKDPIKIYFKKILKIVLPNDAEDTGDEELFAYPSGLPSYKIRDAYLKAAQTMPEKFAGDPDQFDKDFIRRMKEEGNIPFGVFGEETLEDLLKARLKINGRDSGFDMHSLAGNIAGRDLVSEPVSINFGEVLVEGMIKNIERDPAGRDRMILVYPTKFEDKYKMEVLIRHLAANAGGVKAGTNFFCRARQFNLEYITEAEAKYALSVFIRLWQYSKSRIPLFDPELIGRIGKLVKDAGGNGPEEEDIRNVVTGFFEEKWKKRNDEYSYLPLELVTAAEQFLKPGLTARFLDEFPFADVLEAAEIFEKFYPHKKSGQSKK